MSAIIALAKSYIPPADTVERKIFYLFPFLHFYPGPEQGRYQATIASLGLQNRFEVVDDPFIDWMKKDLNQDGIKNPVHLLMQSQLHDLVRKVITSAAFYATSQYSLYATLTALFSQSQRVSQVAQPHLDKIASLPIPRLLKATQVIAFAPVVIKLIHMALIYVDPKGEKSSLNALKKTADKAGRGLECLLHLRFSLISLGVSENLLGCVVKTMFSQAVDYFINDSFIKKHKAMAQVKMLLQSVTFLKPAYGKEVTGFSYFLSILGCTDKSMWPSLGFDLAVKALLTALSASSDSCDIDCLQELFNRIEAITIDQARITQLQKDITQAAKKNKIDTALEDRLLDLLRTKVMTLCIKDNNFEESLQTEGRRDFLKTICCPHLSDSNADDFVALLVALSKLEIDVEKLHETYGKMADLIGRGLFQENFLSEFVVKKINDVFSDENIQKIIADPIALFPVVSLFNLFNNAPNECRQQINRIKPAFFAKMNDALPASLNEECFENKESETGFHYLTSSLPVFATNDEESSQAYLIQARFRTLRFKINLGNYLQPQQPKAIAEQILEKIAQETPLIEIQNTDSFKTWSEQHENSQEVKNFIEQSEQFAFLRDFPQIPGEFNFVNQKLAAKINDIYRLYDIETGGWSYETNFPHAGNPQIPYVSVQDFQALINPLIDQGEEE